VTPLLELSGDIFASTLDSEQGGSRIVIEAPRGPLGAVSDLTVLGNGTGSIRSESMSKVRAKAGDMIFIGRNVLISDLELKSDSKPFVPLGANDLASGRGDGGRVSISSIGDARLINSRFSTSTFSAGDAGTISVNAVNLWLEHTQISSEAQRYSSAFAAPPSLTGAAGSVELHASQALALVNSNIATDTAGSGRGGNITLSGRTIFIDPTVISSNASSTGPAGNIGMNATAGLTLRDSRITTTAQSSDGGNISVTGRAYLFLDRAQITTSVLGSSGNGGNIAIAADALVLRNGFIQANTSAANASGGAITVNSGVVLASGPLLVGRRIPIDFTAAITGINVIQAAAPDGVAGTINLAGPLLDVVGSLHAVDVQLPKAGPLGKDVCRLGTSSSLTPLGRGGLRPTSAGLIRPENAIGSAHSLSSQIQLGALASEAQHGARYRCEY
jgi:hypothetical protein